MAVPQLLTWAQGLMKMPKYSERIPEAVRNNISRLGYYIQSDAFDPTAVTPFLNAMLAKIGKQMITGYQWDDNVFDSFYKGLVIACDNETGFSDDRMIMDFMEGFIG